MTTNGKDKFQDTSMSTSKAGAMGGNKVKQERGSEFYSEIGQKQGKGNNPGNFANRPHDDVVAAARDGGSHSHRGDKTRENVTATADENG